MACPICHGPLRRFHHDGVELDSCDVHGVWFDRDELTQVVRHPQHGREVIDAGVTESATTGTTWMVADMLGSVGDVGSLDGLDTLGELAVGAAELAGAVVAGAVELIAGVLSS